MILSLWGPFVILAYRAHIDTDGMIYVRKFKFKALLYGQIIRKKRELQPRQDFSNRQQRPEINLKT